MVGVNRIRTDGKGLEYTKSSRIINPNGEHLKSVCAKDQLDVYDIDPLLISKFKQSFSTTKDRKPALFKIILVMI